MKLWIACEANSPRDPHRIVVVMKCDVYQDKTGPDRFGPLTCAYQGKIKVPNLKAVAPHALAFILGRAAKGDVIVSDGLAKPGDVTTASQRRIQEKEITHYEADYAETIVLRAEGLVIAEKLGRTDEVTSLPVMPLYIPTKSDKLKRPEQAPAPVKEAIPFSRPVVEVVLSSEDFVRRPSKDYVPKEWVASDISIMPRNPHLAGYAISRLDATGEIGLVEAGVFTIDGCHRTIEAERRALALACKLAPPKSGVACDVLKADTFYRILQRTNPVDQEIADLIEEKELTLAYPHGIVLDDLHHICHRHSRLALK